MKTTKPSVSIRTKLLWWLMPLAVIFMTLAWLIHGLLLERMVQKFVDVRLDQEATFLQQQITNTFPHLTPALTSGHYFDDVFHHAYAIQIGARTIAPNRWKELLTPLLNSASNGTIPLRTDANSGFPGHIVALRKSFQVSGTPVTLVVADDTTVLKSEQTKLHVWTAVVGLGLMGVLLALILLSVDLALRPVRHLRKSLTALQRGHRDRLDIEAPVEFQALISQLNHVLDSMDRRLERSRQSNANLSHSVKTPIAVVRQILTDEEQALTPAIRTRLAERLTDIDRQLEAEMLRARFAGPKAGKSAQPVSQARELVWMLSRLHNGKQFELETNLDPEQRWPVEEDDFNELIGNLADNAGKWAEKCISVELTEHDFILGIIVRDDGPGVADNIVDTLGTRGMRLDQQIPGHGLGLAIVNDIVHRYGGTLTFTPGRNRGLVVRITLPSESHLPDPY